MAPMVLSTPPRSSRMQSMIACPPIKKQHKQHSRLFSACKLKLYKKRIFLDEILSDELQTKLEIGNIEAKNYSTYVQRELTPAESMEELFNRASNNNHHRPTKKLEHRDNDGQKGSTRRRLSGTHQDTRAHQIEGSLQGKRGVRNCVSASFNSLKDADVVMEQDGAR